MPVLHLITPDVQFPGRLISIDVRIIYSEEIVCANGAPFSTETKRCLVVRDICGVW